MSIAPRSNLAVTSSDLEQYAIVKGGSSVCVIGSCYHFMPWSNLAGDYLYYKMLVNKKYNKVLCINMDRRIKDLKEIYELARQTDDISANKLSYIDERDILPPLKDENFINIVDHMMSVIDQELSTVKGKEPYGIFIYSLSELILSIGAKDSLAFVKRLAKLSSVDANLLSTLVVVHESMHSTDLLVRIQSICGVVVKVVPNNGTLSSEVAAEIQSIRKSRVTGKVVESIEMFYYDGMLLQPVPVVNSSKNKDHTSGGGTSDISPSDPALISPPSSSEANSSTLKMPSSGADGSRSGIEINAMNKVVPPTVMNSRFITFDSTDPEFDEDSDPDADLDL